MTILTSCVGDDPSNVNTAPNSTGVGADAGVVACPADCSPLAPPGWLGPSAVYDGIVDGKPASCPAPYSTLLAETHLGLKAAPAVCTCKEGVPSGGSCSAEVLQRQSTGDTTTCQTAPVVVGTATASAGACKGVIVTTRPGVDFGGYVSVDVEALTVTPAKCDYATETTRPASTYATVQLACGLAAPTACSGRSECVATPKVPSPFARLCIQHEGDLACPSGNYGTRFVAHRKVDDTRECGSCARGEVVGSRCVDWWYRLDQSGDCSVAGSTPTDCGGGGSGGKVVIAPPQGGACAAGMPGAPTGEARSVEPITYCCTQ